MVNATTYALASLPREMLLAITAADSRDKARAEVLRVAFESGVPRAILLFQRDSQAELSLALCESADGCVEVDQGLRETCLAAARKAVGLGEVQIVARAELIVVAPVFRRGGSPEAIAFIAPTALVESARDLATLAATHLTLAALLADFDELGETVRSSTVMLDLLEQVETASGSEEAATTLAAELQRHLKCDRVAIALCRPSQRCRLVALSGTDRFDSNSEFVRAVESALDETVLRQETLVYSNTSELSSPAARSLAQVAELANVTSVVTLPWCRPNGAVCGAWLLVGTPERVASPATLRFLDTLAPLVAQSFQLIQRARVGGLASRFLDPLRNRRTTWAVCGLAILAAILSLPMRYRVGCDCDVRPTTRRYVAAPFDSKLDEALAAPGDVVQAEQTLAHLDGRELQWELDAVVVDHDKARKSYDKALAKHKVAEAQLAKLEMERLSLRQKLLQERTRNLSIRSPIDGIVLSGDLQRTEGAPLTIGQTLFEIAPLAEMVVEVAVPEAEVGHVRSLDQVIVSLDAYPGRTWEAQIERIHPRATLLDNTSVFIAEITLSNERHLLRPGMKGRAKILAGKHPLIWNLFHRPYEALMRAYYSF